MMPVAPQTLSLRGNLRARQQKAALVVVRLAQAASMACGVRLDCGFLLPCEHHEKAMNTF
ncbi:hypothetical protein ALISP_1744 [Alicycliphilus sp. B1]|nr:hypothetical protein ALISP_1744 [Alicycliphilus sp. B1]